MARGRHRGAALALATLVAATGCSSGVAVPPSTTTPSPGSSATPSTTSSPPAADRLRVAISFDQPGLGLREGDEYSGLDVDVARYVAQQLGASRIDFVQAIPEQRETILATDQADMVISSYSMTPARAQKVTFAGPYLTTDQDLLVQRKSKIRSLDQLRGFTVCGAAGSSSLGRLVDDHPGLHIVERPTVAECVDDLRESKVKAVTSDSTVLAGYLRDPQARPRLRLVGTTIGTESYGIGLAREDRDLCYRVSEALRSMVDSGEWKMAVRANLPSAKIVGSKPHRPPVVRTCREPASSTSSTSSTSNGSDDGSPSSEP